MASRRKSDNALIHRLTAIPALGAAIVLASATVSVASNTAAPAGNTATSQSTPSETPADPTGNVSDPTDEATIIETDTTGAAAQTKASETATATDPDWDHIVNNEPDFSLVPNEPDDDFVPGTETSGSATQHSATHSSDTSTDGSDTDELPTPEVKGSDTDQPENDTETGAGSPTPAETTGTEANTTAPTSGNAVSSYDSHLLESPATYSTSATSSESQALPQIAVQGLPADTSNINTDFVDSVTSSQQNIASQSTVATATGSSSTTETDSDAPAHATNESHSSAENQDGTHDTIVTAQNESTVKLANTGITELLITTAVAGVIAITTGLIVLRTGRSH